MPAPATATPLQRFRVLDFSRVRAGPTCVRMLADFGADVVRIEPPPDTDPNAAMFADDRLGGDYQNLNRNKRSLTLNVKTPAGRGVVQRLVAGADVVVENWRPDVKRRLGLDYETLRAINPRIILASISGYGQSGPYAGRPAFDQIIQGMGGLMSVTGLPGQGPVRAGLAVSDSSAGLYAAIGILTALLEREHSGQGQWVQASLLHTQIAMMDFQIARYRNDGDTPIQAGNDHPTAAPMGLFCASDGQFNMGVSGDGMWQAFCHAMQQPQWLEDADFATAVLRSQNRKRLNAELQDLFPSATVDHWVVTLNDAGVPAGPVYTVPEIFDDPQIEHLGVETAAPVANGRQRRFVTQPVTLARTPARVDKGAPGLGEHSQEILREAGYTDAEIAQMREQDVI